MQIKRLSDISILLGLFGIVIISIGILLYIHWIDLITLSQSWQRYFHQELIELLIGTKTVPLQTGLLLIICSFLYGILHSAGPGHGKIIIATYLATQPKKLKKSLLLTLLSALMQGLVAIILISIMLIALNLSTRYLKMSEYWLELISYILITLIGLLLSYRASKKILSLAYSNHKQRSGIINKIMPTANHKISAIPLHISCSCCSHNHLLNNKINDSQSWIDDLGIIFTVGIRPCSGALLVLIFSFTIGSYYWGIMATLAMSIGTATTTSIFALLVHYARKFTEQLLIKQSIFSYHILTIILQLLALIGGLLFIVMGLLLALGTEYSLHQVGNPLLAR